MMNDRTDLVLSLCRAALDGSQVNPELFAGRDEVFWSSALDMAEAHGILPLVFYAFNGMSDSSSIGRDVMRRACGAYYDARSKYLCRLELMTRISDVLSHHGIDIMFLKGATLAALYPEPFLRPFSDIDFYLFGDAVEGESAMKEIGVEFTPYFHHHNQGKLEHVLLENHYDFFDRRNHRSNIILDDALKNLASSQGRSCRFTIAGSGLTNVYEMPPTMGFIFIVRHMSAHFASETLPLRMLIDWALFMKKYAGEIDWDYVRVLFDKSGLSPFAIVICDMVTRKMGLDIGTIPWPDTNPSLTEKVWKSIIAERTLQNKKKYSLSYYLQEFGTFFANRWKHNFVYPGESYVMLGIRYAASHLSRKN